jgi:hypothetical protein
MEYLPNMKFLAKLAIGLMVVATVAGLVAQFTGYNLLGFMGLSSQPSKSS